MFQVYFVFFLLIVTFPIGIFILRIIDKKNAKILEEEKTIKKKCLQTEREERAEKFKEEVRIRMAELKEEERQNKLLEEELAAKAKVIKKETKGKQVATTKVVKKEIPAEKSLKPQKILEEKVSTKIDYDLDKIMHNASIRKLYYAIKDILFESDTIKIESYQGLDYLVVECNQICTSIVKLGGFKYLLIHAQSYYYRDNQNKEKADERAFATFNKLKSTDSYTDKHPLLLKTKDTNGGYKLELHSTIQAYSEKQVQEIWDDFNHFSAQFVYYVVANHSL